MEGAVTVQLKHGTAAWTGLRLVRLTVGRSAAAAQEILCTTQTGRGGRRLQRRVRRRAEFAGPSTH